MQSDAASIAQTYSQDVEMAPPPDEMREHARQIASLKNIARDYVFVDRLSQEIKKYHKLIDAITSEYPQYRPQLLKHYYHNFLGYFIERYCDGQIRGPKDYSITCAQPGVECIQRILLAIQLDPFEISEFMINKLDIALYKFTHNLVTKLTAIVKSQNTSLAMLELLVPILQTS
jgi:hypothetical protein